MMTRSNGLVLALLATVLVVGAAQATPPVIEPSPIPDHANTTSCAFPVQEHFTTNGETQKTFSDGTIIITGPLKGTYSANGKSVSLNVAGPAKVSPSGEVTGHGVGVGPIVLANGQVTLAYVAGEVTIANGSAVLLHGHVLLDLCAALAP